MLVALPTFSGDTGQLKNLIVWMGQLGGAKGHRAVIVADPATPAERILNIRSEAGRIFDSVALVTSPTSIVGWPAGPNALWLAAARYAKQEGAPWLFLEPDAVPLSKGWLDALQAEYERCGKPHMGALMKTDQPGLPPVYMAGVAVYPPSAHANLSELVSQSSRAFDISTASAVIPMAHDTSLIHQIWGEPGNPPTFSDFNRPGTSVFSPKQLRQGAALFHRSKDGSLIELLRKKAGFSAKVEGELAVVFPFCVKDQALMYKTISWMKALHPEKLSRSCVLHFDGSVTSSVFQQIKRISESLFQQVYLSRYPIPQRPYLGWPAACNFCFQQCVKFVESNQVGPFLFFEPDAVAITPNWLSKIEEEYFQGGKPFLGIQIGDFDNLHMGHINGTAIYPSLPSKYIPKALKSVAQPWDVEMKPEMIHLASFSKVMQHCGAVVNGCCKPANGNYAKFPTQKEVQSLVYPQSVFFHPCKDGSLIDRLREFPR